MCKYSNKNNSDSAFLLSGEQVSKDDAIIHFEGGLDELNSHLGLVKTIISNNVICSFIEKIQINLMAIMTHASDSKNEKYFFKENEVTVLEREIDLLSENLPKLSQFVMPGRNSTEAQIHIARTIARRAERLFVSAKERQPLCDNAGLYLNRLSDYLFVLSQSV